jgi:CheY-like chemotaxis protein
MSKYMNDYNQTFTILIAEDNSDDCVLVQTAFQQVDIPYNLFCVPDGIELLNFLRKQAKYADPARAPRPDLVLLDLNMPRMDGRQALAEMKADPGLRSIPVVVLSNSSLQEDIMRTYDLGGAGFIIKPQTLEGMVEVVKVLKQYWFEVVELAESDHVKIGMGTRSEQLFPG